MKLFQMQENFRKTWQLNEQWSEFSIKEHYRNNWWISSKIYIATSISWFWSLCGYVKEYHFLKKIHVDIFRVSCQQLNFIAVPKDKANMIKC